MIRKYSLSDLIKLKINIRIPSIIFLKGDLWAGKTTFTKHILNNIFWYNWEVKSPTYTYYNEYRVISHQSSVIWKTKNWELITLYHFDLYRLKNYDEFFAIWAEEIFDNNNWIIIVEWPEILEGYYNADIIIKLKKTNNEDEREIEVMYN